MGWLKWKTVAVEPILFLVVVLLTVILASLWRRLRDRTRRKGSRYYVPTFKAGFDTWESKWTMSRKWSEDRTKAQWQAEFDR